MVVMVLSSEMDVGPAGRPEWAAGTRTRPGAVACPPDQLVERFHSSRSASVTLSQQSSLINGRKYPALQAFELGHVGVHPPLVIATPVASSAAAT